jgi:hypothetical protein
MMDAVIRKARHVLEDPVLRYWLLRRMSGLEKSVPGFVAGHPPYLGDDLNPCISAAVTDIPAGEFADPKEHTRISLPGDSVELSPDDPSALFAKPYADLESLLGAHRFAWVPVAGKNLDADWVAALWRCWADKYGDGDSGWPWHAYTAAERAINIIDFSRRFGLPGERNITVALLARHAGIIHSGLEYFGENYTSNHLANNGRGLLRIGAALGLREYAVTGAKIMVAEAGRIFGRSGVLREGSAHYHLLVTRNYIDSWLDARTAGLEEAVMLREIAERAVAVVPGLRLPGGMPLIGDISPDVSPLFLGRFTGTGNADTWPGNLSPDRRQDALEILNGASPVSPDRLADDGWHRFGAGDWHALSYVPPDGWPPMPGHGHQDLGSFELHDDDLPIIVDPGRGSYADFRYEEASVHNGMTIDGKAPMPANRPYYSDAFRRRIVSALPQMERTRSGRVLRAAGFAYLNTVKSVEREWRFTDSTTEILDRIEGRGRHVICRRLCTTLAVTREGETVIMFDGSRAYRVSPGGAFRIEEITRWSAYGEGTPATQIVSEFRGPLPFAGVIRIVRI